MTTENVIMCFLNYCEIGKYFMIVLTSAKKSLITCTGAFLCALLAGCGGGGGGTAGGGRLSDPCSTSLPTCEQTLARLRGTAATTVPTAGGQSSNPGMIDASLDVDSSSGVLTITVTRRTDTSDPINVTIDIPQIVQEAGLTTVTVDEQTVGEPSYSEQIFTYSTVDVSVLYFGYRDYSGQNFVIIEAASDYQPTMMTTPGGETTYATDSDYLVAGIWAVIGRNPADFEYGVFVDGNAPYDRASISPLTGTATYIGRAEAELSDPGNMCNTCLLSASVTLTADFGTAIMLGSISGKIVNIVSDDIPSPISAEITLGQAMISETEGGFFSGDTQLTYESTLYEGKWGGKFYGNSGSSPPGSAGGTFGGKATTGEAAFIGYFISYR